MINKPKIKNKLKYYFFCGAFLLLNDSSYAAAALYFSEAKLSNMPQINSSNLVSQHIEPLTSKQSCEPNCNQTENQNAKNMHDPTQPPGMGYLLNESLNPSTIYNFHLDGIFIGNNKKIAIINGQQVSVNDKIFNVNVIDIYDNSVRLKDENGEFVISMVNGVYKTPSKNNMRKN